MDRPRLPGTYKLTVDGPGKKDTIKSCTRS